MMPRHVNPVNKKSTAPYNFVPLPNTILTVADGIEVCGSKMKPWERHDEFVPGLLSGWIDLEIETLTPLYVRGAATHRGDGSSGKREPRLRAEPFTTPDGRPAIPGSSLRGMIRTLVEILSFSKIHPVSKNRPFFRTVSDDRLGVAYRNRMSAGGREPRGGILRRNNDEWVIEPSEVLRVKRDMLGAAARLTFEGGGNWTPPWPPQQSKCWVVREPESRFVNKIRVQRDAPGEDWEPGVLVLTGNAPKKKCEFVFLDPENAPEVIQVPDAVLERFHEDDQITQWQERAFDRNKPTRDCRTGSGYLRDGEPVFYVVDEEHKSEEYPDGLTFLGRARMFRLPYDLSPQDLVPQELRDAGLDLAEATFGVAKQKQAIKGRVFFEDALAIGDRNDWFDGPVVPKSLSASKPTTFQHYLTQDGKKSQEELTTYLKGDRTAIRGHKLYWHRWDQRGLSGVLETGGRGQAALLQDLQREKPDDRQHTIARPVKAGVTLGGRIRFENLKDVELGALLSALQLPEGCAHKLGMAKPLGLGSVRISAELRLIDREQRYRTWQSDGVLSGERGDQFRKTFEDAIVKHATTSGETRLLDQQGLHSIARLDVLFRLLGWKNRPQTTETEYMELSGFKDRPVLPTPHEVLGLREPLWRVDPPRAAHEQDRRAAKRPRRPDGRERPALRSAVGADVGQQRTSSVNAVGEKRVKPVETGQTRCGSLHNEGGNWFARFEGDERRARISNPERVPSACADGALAEFYIEDQNKRIGIKCRLERIVKGARREE